MFLEEVLEPTPKKSRSRRSTSPRAVQRRRIQNRLSQRNHRRRAKESSEATNKTLPQYAGEGEGEGEGVNSEVIAVPPMSDNSTMQQGCGLDRTQNLHYLPGSYHEPLQYASSSENSVDYFERQQLSHSQLSSAPATANSAWYSAVDMHNLIAPEDMVSLFSPDREWSQSDIERLSAPMESNATRPDSQPLCACRNSSEPVLGQVPEGFPLWRQNEQGSDMRRIPSAQSHSELDSHRLRSETGHHGPGPGLHNSAAGMPHSTLQGHANTCSSSRLSSLSSSKVSPSAEETSPSPVAELTRRFDSILEAMRTSGFHNFDEMAVAYYTGRFSTGSVPSIMQCSSRGRRLKVILQKLHQDSQEWPKWESRGLQESMSTATASLCVDEIERLVKEEFPAQAQDKPPCSGTTLEQLLSTYDIGYVFSRSKEQSLSPLPSEVAPDKIPHLWSLLTELAGIRNVYCDEIARLLLGILLLSRRLL
ncbi:uncharacterized protein FPRO_02439 [Fusarium proliferatum ET1]|uniref:BZIP domain-containing protein n=1 Tax=Fusarium proliferatum (strain ET1) TaxID=1227346 RepID=A0A1L7V948_FUSPR|nr:uncharacterized protein FPRO_02439 [Fusarium proliferatum ET1]CZR37301.1 uncharacterized protein FPRO_02439 [Fusarium proliferatum ET1]